MTRTIRPELGTVPVEDAPRPTPRAARRAAIDQVAGGLWGAMRGLRCLGSERLLRRGISLGQLHVISLLEAHGPMPMTRLAEHVGVSLSTATGLIDRLVERDLVERFRQPGDRRVVLVRISQHGRQTLAESESLRDDLLARIVDHLDDDQLARLAVATNELRDAVEDFLAIDAAARHHWHGAEPPTPATESTTTTEPTTTTEDSTDDATLALAGRRSGRRQPASTSR